jgi:REP element-mobilizing transposase RayT
MSVQYPGAIYQVMSRGDRREDIFLDDVDRQDLLKTLAEACQKTGWQVHAYCLMRNHFHLVVETPNDNLVEGMRWLLSAIARREPLRGSAFGDGREQGRADCCGGIGAIGVAGGRTGASAQERPGETGDCRTSKEGDDADDKTDCGTPAFGHQPEC